MMEHLGGPLPRGGLEEKLRRDVATTAAGETWVLKIIPDPGEGDGAGPAGTVSVWEREWRSQPIVEIGWMVLPPFQGRGLGGGPVGRGPRLPSRLQRPLQRHVPDARVHLRGGGRVPLPGSALAVQRLAARPPSRRADLRVTRFRWPACPPPPRRSRRRSGS